ncbi:TPA: hypothetical protein KIA93_004428 [Salmonella enterica]|uniref:hypothetical protein n=1 Tax=Salmonella enterica TaxID=28901 RepID=UPI001117E248|nr:hypothetical protein [Salmonella enterica]ECR9820064.1 hypothetical protein [Salmonella enterica]HBD1848083.1 hypothetical protein [Salmonella enterica]
MKNNIGPQTKLAIENLLKNLKQEHPDIYSNGGEISSEKYGDFLITISKLKLILESYQGTEELAKSLYISALGAGDPCPRCGGTGKR